MVTHAKADDRVRISEWRHLMHGLLGVAWLVMAALNLRSGLHNIGFWLEDILNMVSGEVSTDQPGRFILQDLITVVPPIVAVAAGICFAVFFVRGRPLKLLPAACALSGLGFVLQDAVILLFRYYSDIAMVFHMVLYGLAVFIGMCVLTVSWKRYRKQLKDAGVETTDGLFPFLREFGLWWQKREARVFEEPEA